MPRLPRLPLALSLSLLTLSAAAPVAGASDPSANRTLSQATQSACYQAPAGAACQADALADINAARAAEGVGAMTLPAGFGSLTVPQQLLVVSDLERVDRGLAPVLGLSAPLDADATKAAAADADPSPTNFYGTAWSANWEGGYGSALEADFAWMYDDGPGSYNLDCTALSTSGCWGHRDDILYPFSPPIMMGAGAATGQYGPSLTELFVGGVRQTAVATTPTTTTTPKPTTTTTTTTTTSTRPPTVGCRHGRARRGCRRGLRSTSHHPVRRRHRRGG
jgi:hypothetical protein